MIINRTTIWIPGETKGRIEAFREKDDTINDALEKVLDIAERCSS